jgi:CheY-like chemotaxis protein
MARILIVDDAEDFALSLKLYFEARGHEAHCVINGRDALEFVWSITPDVVLLDMALPDIDGPSLLEVLRSYLRIQSLPVVVLTGMNESPMIDRARRLQVNTILLKGNVTPDEILHVAEQACRERPEA